MSIFATIIPNFIAMLVKTKAIVLHSFRYGETKAVIELLTATHGRMPWWPFRSRRYPSARQN